MYSHNAEVFATISMTDVGWWGCGRGKAEQWVLYTLICRPGNVPWQHFLVWLQPQQRCGDRRMYLYGGQATGWECDRQLEDGIPNGRPAILKIGLWLSTWQCRFFGSLCGIVTRTSLEISKTPVVGSDLSSGVAG